MPAAPGAPSSTIFAVTDLAARGAAIARASVTKGIAGMTTGPVVVTSASGGEGLSDVGKLTNRCSGNRGKESSD